jgi:hypothetical protein
MNIEELSVGEEARYSAEFTPKETGCYTIYAYLYHEGRRIGCKTESIYAQKKQQSTKSTWRFPTVFLINK